MKERLLVTFLEVGKGNGDKETFENSSLAKDLFGPHHYPLAPNLMGRNSAGRAFLPRDQKCYSQLRQLRDRLSHPAIRPRGADIFCLGGQKKTLSLQGKGENSFNARSFPALTSLGLVVLLLHAEEAFLSF